MKKGSNLLGIIVVLLALFLICVALYNQQPDMTLKNAELESLNSDIAKAKSEYEALDIQSKRVGSLDFIEEIARRNLGLVKPNETIFYDIDK